MTLSAVGHGVCLSGQCGLSGGENHTIPSRGHTDKPHDASLSAHQLSAKELYDNSGMSPSSLIATLMVRYLVPSANRWRFVWRATGGPLAASQRQQLPLVNHQRSNNRPLDKIFCHSTTIPPDGVYGNGRDCVKLLPARW